jgi:hypothetical protein
MKPISIHYRFAFDDGTSQSFQIELDGDSLELAGLAPDEQPEWTALDFHKCPHCPLDSAAHARCPLAANLVGIVQRFGKMLSYEQVEMEVETEERTVSQRTTAQRGVSSIMGLIMATSGCPHTSPFKPMARFHLPLASKEETLYRAAAMYLLAQFFRKRAGEDADLDVNGLREIYKNIELVNRHVAERLRNAAVQDSTLNAVIILDCYAKTLPYSVEQFLEELAYLFDHSPAVSAADA